MIRNRNIIVTTTDNLEGYEIRAYLGVVSAHVVAGTGLFSDLIASFSDIFGGRSRTYQKQLAAINDEVIEILKEKAVLRGANCIVGLRLDHDEISGGNKSMFMVTATGTAGIARRSPQADHLAVERITKVFAEDLDTMIRRQRLVQAAESGDLRLDNSTWDFLCANQVHEAARSILAAIEEAQFSKDFLERSKSYFRSLPDEEVKRFLYPVVTEGNELVAQYALQMLSEMNLLDFSEVAKMLRSDSFETRKRALALLCFDKATYSLSDAEYLEKLCEQLRMSFVERGRIVEVDQMFSSKTTQKWICECGKKVSIVHQYCAKCFRDIYGFSQTETHPEYVVDLLTRKVAVLRRELGNGTAEQNDRTGDVEGMM